MQSNRDSNGEVQVFSTEFNIPPVLFLSRYVAKFETENDIRTISIATQPTSQLFVMVCMCANVNFMYC